MGKAVGKGAPGSATGVERSQGRKRRDAAERRAEERRWRKLNGPVEIKRMEDR